MLLTRATTSKVLDCIEYELVKGFACCDPVVDFNFVLECDNYADFPTFLWFWNYFLSRMSNPQWKLILHLLSFPVVYKSDLVINLRFFRN